MELRDLAVDCIAPSSATQVDCVGIRLPVSDQQFTAAKQSVGDEKEKLR